MRKFQLGFNPSFCICCFNGSLRGVAVYNRALTDAEVHSNFLNTEYNTNINLPDVLYYKMLDYNANNATSSSFTLYDSSSNSGTTGTYSDASETWFTNQGSLPDSALHFSGSVGYIDTRETG